MRKLGKDIQLKQTDDVLLERLEWCNLRASPLNVGRILDETVKEELLTEVTDIVALAGLTVCVVIGCVMQVSIKYKTVACECCLVCTVI